MNLLYELLMYKQKQLSREEILCAFAIMQGRKVPPETGAANRLVSKGVLATGESGYLTLVGHGDNVLENLTLFVFAIYRLVHPRKFRKTLVSLSSGFPVPEKPEEASLNSSKETSSSLDSSKETSSSASTSASTRNRVNMLIDCFKELAPGTYLPTKFPAIHSLWIIPLEELLEIVGNDLDAAKSALAAAYTAHVDEGLSLKSPKSIQYRFREFASSTVATVQTEEGGYYL